MRKYPDSGDLSFSGIVTFAHLPHSRCLDEPQQTFDIAVLGMPFDTSVSYRPGARFGPNAIRQGSRRHATNRAYSIPWCARLHAVFSSFGPLIRHVDRNFNPFLAGAKVFDCGDVPISPYDNALAMDQIETAYSSLLARPVATDFMQGAFPFSQSRRKRRADEGRTARRTWRHKEPGARRQGAPEDRDSRR